MKSGHIFQRFFVISLVLFFALSVPSPQLVQAQPSDTITVDTLIDEQDGLCTDDCSLRDAIDIANPGDTINFSVSGTINLNGANLQIGKMLTVDGPGVGSLTISGQDSSRVFNILGSGVAHISGLTIRDGNSNSQIEGGGAIYVFSGGKVTFEDCVITDNQVPDTPADTYQGGAIYSRGAITLTNTIVSHNTSYYDGGAIFIQGGGTLYTFGSTITENTALRNGGAIKNFGNTVIKNTSISKNTLSDDSSLGAGIYNAGSLTVEDSLIENNEVVNSGGGIFNESGGSVVITDSTVRDNSSDRVGGGITARGDIEITGSTINGNTAGTNGAGLAILGGVDVSLSNSTFSGNNFGNDGGGVHIGDGNIDMNNVTIAGNSPLGSVLFSPGQVQAGKGGGIFLNKGILNIKNTLIADNSGTSGDSDIFNSIGTLNSFGYNLVESPGTVVFNSTGDITGVDPLLGPLADNGGATETHALANSSQAVDAGSCTDTSGATITIDQRGMSRPQGSGCDIGAYEYQAGGQRFLFLPLIQYE